MTGVQLIDCPALQLNHEDGHDSYISNKIRKQPMIKSNTVKSTYNTSLNERQLLLIK